VPNPEGVALFDGLVSAGEPRRRNDLRIALGICHRTPRVDKAVRDQRNASRRAPRRCLVTAPVRSNPEVGTVTRAAGASVGIATRLTEDGIQVRYRLP
jgi:hypothetical protein